MIKKLIIINNRLCEKKRPFPKPKRKIGLSTISGSSEPINRENLFVLNFLICGISVNISGKAAWNIGKISYLPSISNSY